MELRAIKQSQVNFEDNWMACTGHKQHSKVIIHDF